MFHSLDEIPFPTEDCPYTPIDALNTGEDGPYSPEEEERGMLSAPTKKIGSVVESDDHKTKSESEPQDERSENLDARLNRMMLQEDLPLFLQEFEEVWQDARIKKFGLSGSRDEREDMEDLERTNKPVERSKKEVKRLRKCEYKINTIALKDLGMKIMDRIKDQVKEDILEHLVAEQVETWLLNHEMKHSNSMKKE